jgi:hypothetical protein
MTQNFQILPHYDKYNMKAWPKLERSVDTIQLTAWPAIKTVPQNNSLGCAQSSFSLHSDSSLFPDKADAMILPTSA